MFHRFNERAREAIDRAARRARELRHAIVEPEHILASLAETEQGKGDTSFHSLLKAFDVPKEQVSEALEAVPAPPGTPATDPVFSPNARRVLEFAVDEADRLGHKQIGTSHFLLAFLRDEIEGEGGTRVLSSLGLSLDDARARVREISAEGGGRQDVVPAILFFELDRRARDAEQALRTRVERLEGELAALRSLVASMEARQKPTGAR